MVKRSVVSVLALLALVLATFSAIPTANAQEPTYLTLDIDGLESLGEGFAYEGWLIVDGAPVSSGVFTVDNAGALSQSTFEVDVDPASASAFVLTIEPSPDPDPAPSAVHLLGGDFAEGHASLSVAHGDALGNDFVGAAGGYILAVPSAGDDGSYENGIWFLDPAAGPGPSLDLPDLPDGWVYEGWVVGEDGPVSTGRFASLSGADSDGAGPAAGPNDGPPFPGQDFVDPERNLIGQMAVISIEPQPDDSPAPFVLKPLVDANIEDVGAETLQSLSNNASAFPTGSATLASGDMMDDDMMDDETMDDDEMMDDESMADDEMMDDEMADDESMMEESAPETMPETGATSNTERALPLFALVVGLLLLGGGLAVGRRAS